MPELPYLPEDFGLHMGDAFSFRSKIVFSWEELCRAALTVGRQNWSDVFQYGTYSVLEALWRLAIVRANLVEQADGRLRQSDAFVALDPSEKGAVSYFLGLTFTKLIAEKLFQVPWLLHIDVYKQQINPALEFSVKPDFVGMDPDQQWIVMESKGRTGSASRDLLDTAKRQTRSLRNINGQLPSLRVAVATYFSNSKARARICDPDDFDVHSQDVTVDQEALARAYYRPIVEYLEAYPPEFSTSDIDQKPYRISPFSGMDASVGLDQDILDWYHGLGGTWQEIRVHRAYQPSVLKELRELKSTPEKGRLEAIERDERKKASLGGKRLSEVKAKGLDGITVRLGASWSEQYMRRQPKDRVD